MNKSTADDEIFQALVTNISEALSMPPEKIVPSARLLSDLNAESIDIADIRFRLEHHFNIRIDHKGMVDSLGIGLAAEEFDRRFTVQFILDHVKKQLMEQKGTV
jgi:acyl carrier protein